MKLTSITSIVFCACIMFSCDKKEDPEALLLINTPTIDLKYDETHQFALKKGNEDLFPSTLSWTSADDNVGKVDANGKFVARKIGETLVTGLGSEGQKVESKITISPYVTNFDEPILEFGTSMASIKSKETRELLFEGSYTLQYKGTPGSLSETITYIFDNKKLQIAWSQSGTLQSTWKAMKTFSNERYPIKEVFTDANVQVDDQKETLIYLDRGNYYGHSINYYSYSEMMASNQKIASSLKKARKELPNQ